MTMNVLLGFLLIAGTVLAVPPDETQQGDLFDELEDDTDHDVLQWLETAREAGVYRPQPRGPDDWRQQAQEALRRALDNTPNTNVAKNVIIFIGDGMGVSTVTASRIFQGQEDGEPGTFTEGDSLSFEEFPHVALSKTYEADWQTPDSAGTATAILCGVKTNLAIVGVDDTATQAVCATQAGREVESILYWAEKEGKSTGVVTNTAVTHATPAAAYANSVLRNWENDQDMFPWDRDTCKDIARQLVEHGHDIEVVMGGGRSNFFPQEMEDPAQPGSTGSRGDGRDLIAEWAEDKENKSRTHAEVFTKEQLEAVDIETTDHIFGLFARGHMSYERERPDTQPSLSQMTETAIRLLQKNDDGFFLLVEGGRIDFGHHASRAFRALTETLELSNAVQVAANMTSEEDTLIIVTADHSHSFNLAGYNPRGANMLGKALYPASDLMLYTTLLYGNGPGYNMSGCGRDNIFNTDTTDPGYVQQSAVPLGTETHAGEDVPIYARGPMSHLIQGVQEQHYIAHVAGYAACIGDNKDHCQQHKNRN